VALLIKGGPDGVAIFEMHEATAQRLAAILVANTVSFYCEPWVDGLVHIAVNGGTGDRVEKRLKDDRQEHRRLPNAKEAG
jgi:hypothetical protein